MTASLTASFILKLEDQLSKGIVALSRKLESLAKLSKQVTLSGLDAADRTLDRVGAAADRAGQKVGGIGRQARSAVAELQRMANTSIRVNTAGTAFLPPALARAAMAATILAAAAASGGGGGGGGRPPVPFASAPFASAPLLLGSGLAGGIPLAPLGFVGRNAGVFSAIGSGAAAARAQVAQLSHQVQDLGTHMGELGHAGLTAFATGFGLMHPIAEYAKYENTLRHIAITAGTEREAIPKVVGEMTKQYNQLAIASGQSSEKIAESANFLITTGIGKAAVDKLLPIVARAATAYNTKIGDSVQAVFSLHENLGVRDEDMTTAISSMALAGKEGHFSFSDFSQFLPQIAPIAALSGLQGLSGSQDLMAMLETSRRSAGTSGQAATNVGDFLQHLFGGEKRGLSHEFANYGISLNKLELDAARKGLSAPEAVLEQTRELVMARTKGMSAAEAKTKTAQIVGSLFHNEQSRNFVIAALSDLEYLQRLREKLHGADAHTIDHDFGKASDAAEVKLRQLQERLEQIVRRVGQGFAPALDPMNALLQGVLSKIEAIDERWGSFMARFRPRIGTYGMRAESVVPPLPAGLDKLLLAIGGNNPLDTILSLVGGVLALSAALGLLIPLFKIVGAGARLVVAPIMLLGTAFGVGLLPALIIVGLLAAAAYLLYTHWDGVVAFFQRLCDGLQDSFGQFVEWVRELPTRIGTSIVQRIKNAWSDLKGWFSAEIAEWTKPFMKFVDDIIAKINEMKTALGLAPKDPKDPKAPLPDAGAMPGPGGGDVPYLPMSYRPGQGGGADQLLINIKVDQDGRVRAVDPSMPGGRTQIQVDRGDMTARA